MLGQVDVPEDLSWLHPAEKVIFSGFRFPKKQNDWLLGRWTAKNLIIQHLHSDIPELLLKEIEVRAADDGAPEAFKNDSKLPFNISISHSHGIGFCALTNSKYSIGCDLEKLEKRSPALIKDHFTKSEQSFLERFEEKDRLVYSNLIWSAKESALKTMRTGLRIDTRLIEVEIPESKSTDSWQTMKVIYSENDSTFQGYWRVIRDSVCTITAMEDLELISQ